MRISNKISKYLNENSNQKNKALNSLSRKFTFEVNDDGSIEVLKKNKLVGSFDSFDMLIENSL